MAEALNIQSSEATVWTVVYSFMGVVAIVLVSALPKPYLAVDVLKFGILPSIAVIAVVGAIRGPLAGFLTGYFGTIVVDLAMYNAVVTGTLPAVAYGVLGLVAGLGTYDFSNGRSLGKLAILSAVGFVFTALLVTVIALMVEVASTLAIVGFVLLPLLTMGLPTVIFLTPVLAWFYHASMSRIISPVQ
ncbi:MAG: hypothetical protein ACW975_07755 [Candidatus Thorarchaeota archaeon]|jgi:hypothetical protein